MIELIMVIVIIGILAAVAIPRFINLQSDAQDAACAANVGAIRSAISNFYARTALTGTATWPASLAALVTTYLSALPDCPVGSNYEDLYVSTTGVISTHSH